jgi:hypothetical protein
MNMNTIAEPSPASCVDDLRELQAQQIPAMTNAMRAAILCIDEGNFSRAAVVLSNALALVDPQH